MMRVCARVCCVETKLPSRGSAATMARKFFVEGPNKGREFIREAHPDEREKAAPLQAVFASSARAMYIIF